MYLYKIKLLYLGKDLDDEVLDSYIVAKNDIEVYKYLNEKMFGEWAMHYGEDDVEKEFRERILKNKGDFEEEYMGEFYDVKYGWEKISKVSKDEIIVLKKLKIIE